MVEYFYFSSIPFSVVSEVFADRWTPEQIEVGYDTWYSEFDRRYRLLYRTPSGEASGVWLIQASRLTRDFNPYEVQRAIWQLWFADATLPTSEEEARALRHLPYPAYLQTHYWRKVRAAVLIANRFECKSEHCVGGGSLLEEVDRLHVHHLHYKNRGREQLNNLILLCSRCHQRLHDGTLMLRDEDVRSAIL
jgi:hypothetical protein